jgi:hypothetical protein
MRLQFGTDIFVCKFHIIFHIPAFLVCSLIFHCVLVVADILFHAVMYLENLVTFFETALHLPKTEGPCNAPTKGWVLMNHLSASVL